MNPRLPEVFQGGLGAVIGLLLLVVAVFWLFLPITIWQQLKEIIRLLRSIETQAERAANNTSPAGQKTTTAVRYIPGIND